MSRGMHRAEPEQAGVLIQVAIFPVAALLGGSIGFTVVWCIAWLLS